MGQIEHIKEAVGRVMEKIKRCEYWDCGWCYHHDTKTGKCPGFDRCKILENVRRN